MKTNPSFGRSVYEGMISGPSGKVVDTNTGLPVMPQTEAVPYIGSIREVTHRVVSASGVNLSVVVDFQESRTADTSEVLTEIAVPQMPQHMFGKHNLV